MNNNGRMLHGSVPIPPEDLLELGADNQNEDIDPCRSYGREVTMSWIFGLLECLRQDDVHYKSDELRLFIVERSDYQTLLPILRSNVQSGSMIWSEKLKHITI
ncbi:hypothetical protein RF11_03988 [Thelohanellus kitauei]|uniref:Uncharacterized protein n=1 Tax=Thelohanellus kitauei TaxID=669202 RepID=A0A0C2IV86_THEKT|nr:hypothetical protein RF11_03988 [Thelohanellus kitauei]